MSKRIRLLVTLCLASLAMCGSETQAAEPSTLPTNEAIDLLKSVKLDAHTIRGTWKRSDDGVVSEVSPDSLLMLPVAISGNFELDCEFTRRTGKGSVSFICPIGKPCGLVTVAGWEGAASGLGVVNGTIAPKLSPATGAVVKPSKIANGERYRFHLSCIHSRGRVVIKATLNNRPFVAWRGRPEALTCIPHWILPCPHAIGILVTKSSLADIHSLQLTITRGSEGYQLGDDWQIPISAPFAEPPKQIADRCLKWNGRYYLLSEEPVDLAEAQRIAVNLNGRLLTISSAEEEAFIMKQGRGLNIWIAGWRQSGKRVWRDERNHKLNYLARWAARQPNLSNHYETRLAIHTAAGRGKGLHDHNVGDKLHACIEWGEEDVPSD